MFKFQISFTVKPSDNGPVYSCHLAISQGWPLYTGLTVFPPDVKDATHEQANQDFISLLIQDNNAAGI